MLMPDVNVLLYAHRAESERHERYAKWLVDLANGPSPFALSEPVMQSFIRIVTNARVFDPPSRLDEAFGFLDELTKRRNCILVRPGSHHLPIFRRLCEEGQLKTKLVADAAHAALAIEFGCVWVSADTDFARFVPLLQFQHL